MVCTSTVRFYKRNHINFIHKSFFCKKRHFEEAKKKSDRIRTVGITDQFIKYFFKTQCLMNLGFLGTRFFSCVYK